MKVLTHGSLFAGIGGFDLGFERAGIKTVWQVEIDGFCRKVLEKHWPNVRRYEDITRILPYELPRVDIISGGFPCQDISSAGRREGIDGSRSGLWREYMRVIRELRPRVAVLENVSALLHMGLGRILGELAASGYDAEWDCLPAVAFGAPHIRDRIWILAYPMQRSASAKRKQQQAKRSTFFNASRQRDVADPDVAGLHAGAQTGIHSSQESPGPRNGELERSDWWATEPDVGRVAHGISARVDRLKGLGNAVVPQIAEWIGKRIIEAVAGESGRNPVESISENEADR